MSRLSRLSRFPGNITPYRERTPLTPSHLSLSISLFIENLAKDKKIADDKALQALKEANDKSLQDRLRQIREEMSANQLAIESSTSITEQATYFEKLTQLKKEQFFLSKDY